MMNYKMFMICLFGFLYSQISAQISSFENGNEGWVGTGDVVSTMPAWVNMGGNPNGYCTITDLGTGGIWYWVAPQKYLGNKCDAYGKYLRYDQFTSDTLNQSQFTDRPDVVLFTNGGIQMVYDNTELPGLNWTHFDILLTETSGWHIGTNAGPVPSQAQFLAALSNITNLQIRGEYRIEADLGGLDNVIFESLLLLDLDASQKTPLVTPNDFFADSICTGSSPIVDTDVTIEAWEGRIDSLLVFIQNPLDGTAEYLDYQSLPSTLAAVGNGSGALKIFNTGNASVNDFRLATLAIQYHNDATFPSRAVRLVQVSITVNCNISTALARIPVFPTGDAGIDATAILCEGDPPEDLRFVLQGTPDLDGTWWPPLLGIDNDFDPGNDIPGIFRYIVKSAKDCPNDTSFVTISSLEFIELGPDQMICDDEPLEVFVKEPEFNVWIWNTGETTRNIKITEPATYSVTVSSSGCTFTDTIKVEIFNCKPCSTFIPNVFKPYENSDNSTFQAFSDCLFFKYELKIYNRWGQSVFVSQDPQKTWDGKVRGKIVPEGVYIWVLEIETEVRGKVVFERKYGSVTVL
jgi:gliding motility-associated-like protein